MRSDGSPLPLLVVQSVERDPRHPQQLRARVDVGGHPIRVVLDFSRRERIGIEYVEMPKLLDIHRPSQQAVVELLTRMFDGETIMLPRDLTDAIRRELPPSPYEPIPKDARTALEAMADAVAVDIDHIELTGAEPCRFRATLRVDGREIELAGEIYAGSGRVPIVFWRKGPPPNSLSEGQHYAVHRALVRRCAAHAASPRDAP